MWLLLTCPLADDYKDRIGSTERIFFGIGSFGPSGNMGKCYQMYLDTGDDPTVVIGQVKKNIVLVNFTHHMLRHKIPGIILEYFVYFFRVLCGCGAADRNAAQLVSPGLRRCLFSIGPLNTVTYCCIFAYLIHSVGFLLLPPLAPLGNIDFRAFSGHQHRGGYRRHSVRHGEIENGNTLSGFDSYIRTADSCSAPLTV